MNTFGFGYGYRILSDRLPSLKMQLQPWGVW